MKRTRHSEEQIAFGLKQAGTDTPMAEVIRRMGISEQTFMVGRRVYGGGASASCGARSCSSRRTKLKQLVAGLSLDKHILQDVLSKKL